MNTRCPAPASARTARLELHRGPQAVIPVLGAQLRRRPATRPVTVETIGTAAGPGVTRASAARDSSRIASTCGAVRGVVHRDEPGPHARPPRTPAASSRQRPGRRRPPWPPGRSPPPPTARPAPRRQPRRGPPRRRPPTHRRPARPAPQRPAAQRHHPRPVLQAQDPGHHRGRDLALRMAHYRVRPTPAACHAAASDTITAHSAGCTTSTRSRPGAPAAPASTSRRSQST